MTNPTLLNYIKQKRSEGTPDENIRHVLLAKGWNAADIEAAFSEIDAPTPPKTPGSIPPPPPGNFHPAAMNAYHTRVQAMSMHKKPRLYSPYSFLLAILLTILLFILSGRIARDVMDLGHSEDLSLILESGIVLVFVGIALYLHKTLEQKSKKFLILAQPYYIAAGYMVLRLLYHASVYILDRNVTYGIYIVLVLIIAVLSGVILFLQKYIKHHDL